jgi:hypothetical protein
MVDRLIDAGLVQRSIPTTDRREISLKLTNSGRRKVRTRTERRRRDLRRVVDQIPGNRRTAVARAMTDFADAADRVWGNSGREPPSIMAIRIRSWGAMVRASRSAPSSMTSRA